MKCIYDKKLICEINPDGPRTEDFVCLGCHKPEEKSGGKKDENIKREVGDVIRHPVSSVRGKRGGKGHMSSQKMRGRRRKRRQGDRDRI